MFGWKIAVLALGSNLGDRGETLHSAIEQLGAHPKIRVLEKSPLVESIAVTESGLDESKPNYLNGVVKIATKLPHKNFSPLLQKLSFHTVACANAVGNQDH